MYILRSHITWNDCYLLQIDVLPGIVEEVNNRAEIYIDGGIRSGADVFKALALGARAVFLGRPVIWGLIYDVSQILL